MPEEKAESIRLTANVSTSKLEYLRDPGWWEDLAEQRLREKLVRAILRGRVETVQTEHMVEKRVDLYVARPDVFWSLVEQEAKKIASRGMKRS